MKRALVLSGGGAKGSWSGGVIEYLIKDKGLSWDYVIGTSTGSLLAPLSAIKEIERLKEAYTSVNNKSIFNISPFKENGKLRIFNAIWRIMNNKSSLGQANNLKKKIKEIITEEDFNRIIEENKEVISVVSNMTTFTSEYKSTKTETYEDYCDWLLASASVPLLFEVKNKNNCQYLDGGILEPVPLQKAINMGATEIDVIVLSAENVNKYDDMENIFNVAMRTIDFMNKEITKDDILIGKLHGEAIEIKINIYRTPFSLTKNSIIFNKEEMLKWWKMGYDFAKNHHVEKYKLKRTKTNKIYKIK